MNPSVRRIVLSRIKRAGWPVGVLLLLPLALVAQPPESGVACLKDVGRNDRGELTEKLQKITGWTDLQFGNDGVLRRGSKPPVGGSPRARILLGRAMSASDAIVIEDVSRDPKVIFSRARYAKAKHQAVQTAPVFVIQIDFADFHYVTGDQMALKAFDLGWVVLHELDHIVNDSLDANYAWETGDCETHINLMREECGLPVRQDYFFTFLPTPSDSVFARRFVRLAFEKDVGGTRTKFWLVWDADLVGLPNQQIASLK